MRPRIPVTILTGFLGAGKTTFLNRLIEAPGFADTAVIVNEFGEVGVDGALVTRADERAFEMSVGCLCCTVSGDVRLGLLRLVAAAEAGTGPAFSRVVIETTGLADPAPLLQTFISDAEMIDRFALNGVVTLVDAVQGGHAIERFAEASRQVAVADLLLVTKADLARDPVSMRDLDRLRASLRLRNPNARVLDAASVDAATVFSLAAFDPAGKPPDVRAWLNFVPPSPSAGGHHHHHDANRHGDTATAFCMGASAPVESRALIDAIGALQATFGPDLLRIKGLVAVTDAPGCPVVIHAVGHVMSPPRILDGWPDGLDATRLILIVGGQGRGMAPEMLYRFLPQLRPMNAVPAP